MIKCRKCGLIPNNNESDLAEHHIIPKFMGGKDIDGRVYLCGDGKGNDCHKRLHSYLKQIIKEETEKWLND